MALSGQCAGEGENSLTLCGYAARQNHSQFVCGHSHHCLDPAVKDIVYYNNPALSLSFNSIRFNGTTNDIQKDPAELPANTADISFHTDTVFTRQMSQKEVVKIRLETRSWSESKHVRRGCRIDPHFLPMHESFIIRGVTDDSVLRERIWFLVQ